MSWLRRLLPQVTKQTEIKGQPRSVPSLQTLPTVKFDGSTVSENVKADLWRSINSLPDLEKKHTRQIYEAVLRSILAGRDLQLAFAAIMAIDGMSGERAAEISRSLNDKATALIGRERQAALGITQAKWMYSKAPCMRDPNHPMAADVQRDSAHRSAHGKRYEIGKGLFVDGKWTWPGVEEGCKCSSRAILPGLNE